MDSIAILLTLNDEDKYDWLVNNRHITKECEREYIDCLLKGFVINDFGIPIYDLRTRTCYVRHYKEDK